ncbi:MAG: J domain-containing protein [Dehalococcoidia bacterium]
MAESFYDVLEVPRDADAKAIRSAYRRLARRHHPDVNSGDKSAEERFKKVNEAYEVLSDKKLRKDYDEFGDQWRHADDIRKAGMGAGGRRGATYADFGNGGPGGSSMFDFFDMGGMGFGGAGARQRGVVSHEGAIEVTLEEAYRGTTRVITLSPTMSGTESRRLEVRVPAGIHDGGKIRLRPDDSTDVTLTVRVLPDSRFRREGANLHTEVSVDLLDAVLGGEVEVPTMTGRVALKVPPGTQNGRSFRIAGKGMPKSGGAGHGDLFATVKVRLPESLSDEERRLFEQLRSTRSGEGEPTTAGRGD